MKYVHTNLVAKDWLQLSQFYQKVFQCRQIGQKRELTGAWLEKLTGIQGVEIVGEHLAMPGFGENTPTLEIFTYKSSAYESEKHINTSGLGHLAFQVDNVQKTLALLLDEGGTALGEVVTQSYEGNGTLTVVYAKDPEGNFIEIQSWT